MLENDTDPDGDLLEIHLVTEPLHGVATVLPLPDGTYCSGAWFVRYQTGVAAEPVPDDRFTYEAWDGDAASAPATVTLDYADPA